MDATITPRQWSTDVLPEQLPPEAVTDLENILFKDQRLCQVVGYAQFAGTLSGSPRYMLPNQESGNAYWIYLNDSAVYVTDGTTHWTITWAGMASHSSLLAPFTGGILNQRPFINSAQDGPFAWDQNTANVMTMLAGWPSADRCNAMRPFRDYLIAMNVFESGTRYPDLLKWSDIAGQGSLPTNWTPSASSKAGSASVGFNPGALVDGRQLLDRFIVYKTHSTYLLQLIGGQFVFNQRPIFSTVGALATDCVEEWRGKHYVLTDGDLVVHDSLQVQSLVKDQVRREIFDPISPETFDSSYLALDKQEGHLYVCRPRVGETYPSEALIIGLKDGHLLGHRELPSATPHMIEGLINVAANPVGSTWATRTTTWNTDGTRWFTGAFSRNAQYMVAADQAGSKLQQFGEAFDLDGDTLAAKVERKHLDFGDPKRRKYAHRIRPRIEGNLGDTVSVQLGHQDDPNSDPIWAPAQDFIIGTDRELAFKGVQGRYISYRMTTSSVLRWSIPDLQIEFEPMGPY